MNPGCFMVDDRWQCGYEKMRCRVEGPNGVRVWAVPSHVKNNVDTLGADDGAALTPEITRLVEEEEFQVSPRTIEANDPFVIYGRVKAKTGSTVLGMGFMQSKDGKNGNTTSGEPAQELSLSDTQFPTSPGTYRYIMTYTIDGFDGENGRRSQAIDVVVLPEQDRSYPAEAVNATIQAHKTEIARILAHGVYSDSVQYPAEEWESSLDKYQDGTVSADNMEAAEYRLRDTSNRFHVQGTDNRVDVVHGLTEQQMDRLRFIFESDTVEGATTNPRKTHNRKGTQSISTP
jgi:hypothetical protein